MSDVLAARYASKEMVRKWSDDSRYTTWRQVWWLMAGVLQRAGITDSEGKPRITAEQVDALGEAVDQPIDYAKVAEYEKRFKHDVMAHIHALGDAVPQARDIIHLGATSCDVTDNADLILTRGALRLIHAKVTAILKTYIPLLEDWHSVPCLGYTHYQPAQLTTVGKRFALWAQDLYDDCNKLDGLLVSMRLRGLKGATGTQASFMELAGQGPGAAYDVKSWDQDFTKQLCFGQPYTICGQTYPRKFDVQVVTLLADIAQSAHKFATDLRLLQHDGEMQEPFEEEQVGSSAMAYKQNPMRSERICSLARYVMGLVNDAYQTAANQWLERTLDDSANRRVIIPQAFLAVDGILRTYLNILQGIRVNKEKIAANVQTYLPFMITEAILMRAVKAGWDRQKAHEAIRQATIPALDAVRVGRGQPLWHNFSRVFSREIVFGKDMNEADPRNYTGRAQEQVAEFASLLAATFKEWTDQEQVDLDV